MLQTDVGVKTDISELENFPTVSLKVKTGGCDLSVCRKTTPDAISLSLSLHILMHCDVLA
jgi:hypothetical protein